MVIHMSETTARPVPVVRLIVCDPSGRVLILQRAADSTDGGRWCLPGGKVDYGDTAEQSATRELVEETSLRATALRFLFYQDSLPPAPGRMHCINLYFLCAAEGEVVLNEESIAAAWIGSEDFPRFDLAFRNDEALLRYWKESQPKES
jgi:8-oxo-dGTP pyrophosphatase MutT (NUDIX family)